MTKNDVMTTFEEGSKLKKLSRRLPFGNKKDKSTDEVKLIREVFSELIISDDLNIYTDGSNFILKNGKKSLGISTQMNEVYIKGYVYNVNHSTTSIMIEFIEKKQSEYFENEFKTFKTSRLENLKQTLE